MGPLLLGDDTRELNAVEFYNVDIFAPTVPEEPAKKTGRRPGDSGSREAITAAARRRFGELGYDGTTIRAVAADAGVDPGLVVYFFGSKDGLFAASISWPFDPARELPEVIAGGTADAGHRLVRLFLATWDAEEGRNPIVALLRAATHQEAAQRQLRTFLETQILGPLLTALGSDEPELRAGLVAAQLLGLGITRHVLALEPLASLDAERVVELVGPSVQRALSDPLPRRAASGARAKPAAPGTRSARGRRRGG
jgi:AcrR family transcriptional regulator